MDLCRSKEYTLSNSRKRVVKEYVVWREYGVTWDEVKEAFRNYHFQLAFKKNVYQVAFILGGSIEHYA